MGVVASRSIPSSLSPLGLWSRGSVERDSWTDELVSLLDPGQCLCLVEVGTEGAGGRWDGGGREVLNEDDKRVYPVPGLVTPVCIKVVSAVFPPGSGRLNEVSVSVTPDELDVKLATR